MIANTKIEADANFGLSIFYGVISGMYYAITFIIFEQIYKQCCKKQ